MNYRHLPGSSLRASHKTWVQVLVTGVLFLAIGSSAKADPQPLGPKSVLGKPVALPPKDLSGKLLQGAGLCSAFRMLNKNDDPLLLTPSRPSNFPNDDGGSLNTFAQTINDFMDGVLGIGNGPIEYATLQTPFDLASEVEGPQAPNVGDFVGTPGCGLITSPGCPFPGSKGKLAVFPAPLFGSRYRGFLLIPDSLQGQPLHFGFLTQNVVAMRVYQKVEMNQAAPLIYEVVSRAGQGSIPGFRTTNQVTFMNPGLYPVEILYAFGGGNSPALEMAVLASNPSFVDYDGSTNSTVPLTDNNFLLNLTMPAQFFQTSTGALPFDGAPATCQQCPRKYANSANQPKPPNNVCPGGMFCNEAAVCSPCVGDLFCGKTCMPCMGSTPFCARDPVSGGADLTCVECRDDHPEDCKSGQKCVIGHCISPCPCCDDAPYCVPTDIKNQPLARNCSACRTDTDCGEGKCDLLNGRCVTKIADCNTDDRCGAECLNCGTATINDPQGPRPHCLNGQVCVQCRYDVDCGVGTYCRSGDCVPCTHDRHCGPSCRGCGLDILGTVDGQTQTAKTEKPFCLAPNGQAENSVCVRCLTDANCGTGGTCDPVTHECSASKCATSCPADKVCNGTECVECFTSAQCKCGQCLQGVCTSNCGDSTDCRSNQCCSQEEALCMNGRCKPGLTAHGGALCCEATGGGLSAAKDPAAPGRSSRPLWGLLAALGLLGALRFRSLRLSGRPKAELGGGGRE